jgi:serine/threonine protein phosphatase PrpC
VSVLCPSCAEPVGSDDRFCEACGADVHADGPSAAPVGADLGGATASEPSEPSEPSAAREPGDSASSGSSTRVSTRVPSLVEPSTAAAVNPAPGTARIVRRRPGEIGPADHLESDRVTAAAVSDRGLHHARNEDAFGLAVRDGWTAAVVCDGVSTTVSPERASRGAARAALSVLELVLAADWWPDAERAAAVLVDAVAAAQRAVARVGRGEAAAGLDAPSTTIVAVLVGPGQAVVANVGDSRAYWVAAGTTDNLVLTVDDSWAEEAIALGVAPADAYADAQAHVITRWLGADAGDSTPNLQALDLDDEGAVIVCTDGLWNYFPSPDELRSAIAAGGLDRPPLAIAQELVASALAAGGHDNVTVAVIPSHPLGAAPEPNRE